MTSFSDPTAVSGYAERTARIVPGLCDLHRMAGVLLAERAPADARIYIDSAPKGPFDGATCLLTLHFLPPAERLKTLQQMHLRLKPGAPLVVAHHSFPGEDPGRDRWLSRNAAFAATSGVPVRQAEGSIAAIKERLPVLSPVQDVDLLREAGFTDIDLFYCAFTFKGWVAHRA